MTAAAFFHLEMDMVASWDNVATTFAHKPDLSCAATDHGAHLLKTVDPETSRQVRASRNGGSEMTQAFVALSDLQSNGYRDLLIHSLRAIADTTNMFSLW